jgi:ribosome biogenesis GTPase
VVCELSTRLRKVLVYPTADPHSLRPVVRAVQEIRSVDPVAVGDRVAFVDREDGRGLIVDVLPRKNRLARQAAGVKPLEQVIVANLDYVVAVFAAAQAALICITKVDLARDDGLNEEIDTYREIGYPVVLTSTVTGEGLNELRAALRGRLSVLVGKSGVGKTSLLNALQPDLGLRVNQVSRSTGKGLHTTTDLAMFPLESGGCIVDTPGMREFGLWEVDGSDLALLFPEMRPLVGACRFGLDCAHNSEPGCAIHEAVKAGKISLGRYQSYLRMRG